jgi:hypothetical protein
VQFLTDRAAPFNGGDPSALTYFDRATIALPRCASIGCSQHITTMKPSGAWHGPVAIYAQGARLEEVAEFYDAAVSGARAP